MKRFLVTVMLLTLAAWGATVAAAHAAGHTIYLVQDNDLFCYNYLGAGNVSNSWGASRVKIGNGWSFRRVFSGGDGVIFAIAENGDLLYYKFLGAADCANSWGLTGARIGSGWGNFVKVFSGGDGVIFGIARNGDLFYTKYLGMRDGSATWSTDAWGRKIGTGWISRDVFYGGDGVIFSIAMNGDLQYHKYLGMRDGSATWATSEGKKIGTGWNFRTAFSGGGGAIFSITGTADLLYHKYLGMRDGSASWGTSEGLKIGNGWAFAHVFAELPPAPSQLVALRKGAAPPAPAPLSPPVEQKLPVQPAGGYRMTGWSDWSRAAGVEYRYRVGWDPANSRPGGTVDAIYELRNSGGQAWSGAARSVTCGVKTLWDSTDAALPPGQTKEVRVRAPNCGNATNPNIRPDVVRAGRVD